MHREIGKVPAQKTVKIPAQGEFLLNPAIKHHLEYDPVKKLNAADDREASEKAHVSTNLERSLSTFNNINSDQHQQLMLKIISDQVILVSYVIFCDLCLCLCLSFLTQLILSDQVIFASFVIFVITLWSGSK